MKLSSALFFATTLSGSTAFINPSSFGVSTQRRSSSATLSMVLEKPRTEKKLSKLEILKTQSEHLTQPLKDVSTTNKKNKNFPTGTNLNYDFGKGCAMQ